MPTKVRHKFAAGLGKLAYKHNAKRRAIVKINLTYCFPHLEDTELSQISQEHFKYAAIGILEICVLIFASKTRLKNMLAVDNEDYLDSVINKQGVLLLLAHSTTLDFAAVALDKYNIKGSYNPFHNKVIDFLVQYARCRFVNGVIARKQGLRPLVRELKNRKPLVYLPDEDFGRKHSVMAKFFAAEKATLNIPSRLVKLTESLAIPIMIVWDENLGKYRMKSLPPLTNYPSGNEAEDARVLNAALEKLIKPHLSQYMWTLKLLRTRPEGGESYLLIKAI